jgi:hypothetical protein
MPLHLTKEFLDDLKDSKDARFIRQVLNHCIGEDGTFTPNKDDHRYDGIEDGWIRYVSRGTSAYRIIFIRKGSDVFLYRAGGHSVEENLHSPKTFEGATEVRTIPQAQRSPAHDNYRRDYFLKTTEARFINRHIQSLYHVRHKEIYLVSPFVELSMLESRHEFGRFLDRAIEEGTIVVLITASSRNEDERLSAFKKLEERGIFVFFLQGLHSKLYLFDIDLASLNRYQQGLRSHVMIGSSNLTYVGLGLGDVKPNEELNCSLSSEMVEEARTYVTRLTKMADDYQKYAFRMRRRHR